jgi:general secretion pathway protein H
MSTAHAPRLVRRVVRRRGLAARAAAGLTVLELLIVLALIALAAYLGYSAFARLSGIALVEDTNDLVAVMRRTQVLAVETGMPSRVVLDFDKQAYWVEVCSGEATLRRTKEEDKLDPKERAKALEDAKRKIALLPAGQLKAGSAEEEARMALALAGDKTGGRACVPADDTEELKNIVSGDAMGRRLVRKLQTDRDVKLREVWVQHLDDSVTSGQVSINFFPLGWSEKAILELGDGNEVHTLLLHGATGRVEILAGRLTDPDDHMLRQADGERERDREEQR